MSSIMCGSRRTDAVFSNASATISCKIVKWRATADDDGHYSFAVPLGGPLDSHSSACVIKESAYRRHETGTESALVMLFPIFASSQFVEEQRRIAISAG
jgi:hypothetical protein